MTRQSDIEIHVESELPLLVEWLRRVAGPMTLGTESPEERTYETRIGTVTLTPKDDDSGFVSVYFQNDRSPWATELACARDAAKALGCAVRCEPGDEFPEANESPDAFLEIRNGEEKIVTWGESDE